MRNPNGRMSPTEIKKQLAQSDTTAIEMLRFVFGSVLKRRGLVILNVFLLTLMAVLNFVVPQFTKILSITLYLIVNNRRFTLMLLVC